MKVQAKFMASDKTKTDFASLRDLAIMIAWSYFRVITAPPIAKI